MKRLTRPVICGAAAFAGLLLPGVVAAQQASPYVDGRLSQFERSISELRAKLEQLRQQNQRLQQDADKMRADHERRLQALEKGTGKPPPSRAPQSRNRGGP